MPIITRLPAKLQLISGVAGKGHAYVLVFMELPLIVRVYAAHLSAVEEGVAPEDVGGLTALAVGAGVGHDGDLEAGRCAANGGGEKAEGGPEIHVE